MKTLVVYDSPYGNTAEVAKAISEAIGDEAKALPVGDVSASDLQSLDLLVAGAPTHGGRPSPPMREFPKKLPKAAVEGISVAAFDTRIKIKWLKIIGYAAGKIAKNLKKRGATSF
ncbi:flavodoxin family protein [Chloroflexota bacterium]